MGASPVISLPWPQQRRNLILFALCTGMQYLAAPVLYVGITQASLCTDHLGANTRTANLPGTLFFAMTAVPALIAWLSPRVGTLKRNLSLCYATSGLMCALVAITLAAPVSKDFKIAMVILQGGVSGAVMPAAIASLWEVIGRGSDESKRGLALGLAFGAGPILAVLGSLGQTVLLGGRIFWFEFEKFQYPTSFIILFGAGAPIMAIAACLAQLFAIDRVAVEKEREPLSSVVGLLIGLPLMFSAVLLMQFNSGEAVGSRQMQSVGYICAIGAALTFLYHFRFIFQQRVLLLATVVTILLYSGNVIPSNMNLYSEEALGGKAEDFAGVQNMLRFSMKVIAGTVLGFLLTRTSPRAGMLATSGIFLSAMLWAIFVTGPWYLVAFGLHGAGELIGVYAPNYIVSASHRNDLRRNMAFVTMLMVPAAPAGYLYGKIVDDVKAAGWTALGMNSEALGFRLSFAVCAFLILCGIILAATLLPAKPRVEAPDVVAIDS